MDESDPGAELEMVWVDAGRVICVVLVTVTVL